MTVNELKKYNDDAQILIVDWTTGAEFEPTIGSDDLDEGNFYCRIGF